MAFGSLAFRNKGVKSTQYRLINENETGSLDLSRLDQRFLRLLEEIGKPNRRDSVLAKPSRREAADGAGMAIKSPSSSTALIRTPDRT
jgi:hypothetical protein